MSHQGDFRRAALNGLEEELRVVVILRYYAGLNPAAIGAALGILDGTVRSRLHDALRTLKGLLDDAFHTEGGG